MKFTLSWLKDHLDTDADLDTIVGCLTRIGLEVEAIENPAKLLEKFLVASVVEAMPHPNADRLRVCRVDIGSGDLVQVVCGAPNARAGMKSVFSPPGTYIPGKDITLGSGVIRGVESHGMLCSAAELQLSDEQDGILDLASDALVGESYARFLGLDDPVIDVAITPNRADAASVYGIARDLAAAGLGTLKRPKIHNLSGDFVFPVVIKLEFSGQNGKYIPHFVVREVRGVTNGPSPEWLQRRLRAIGLRPISAIVDITNYITFDHGRPLHVFDADKITGDLVVRRAKSGEILAALDGRNYMLETSDVVIADEGGVVSLAGVMGGAATGCCESTVNVLIESALWDPQTVAQTGRRLGINSDASYRFERGVDPESCEAGAHLATQMIVDHCGGKVSQLAQFYPENYLSPSLRIIDFPWGEVKRLTSLDLPISEMTEILKGLGFEILELDDRRALLRVPSFRADIAQKADLVEEIMRLKGVESVVSTPLPRLAAEVARPVLTPLQKREQLARRLLAGLGLMETFSWSFLDRETARLFGGDSPTLTLVNPIASDLAHMRPSLLPGLIKAVERNFSRGLGDVALFEVGSVFLGDDDKGQTLAAAVVRRGYARARGPERHWRESPAIVSAYDAKEDALGVLSGLGISLGGLQIVRGTPSWFHPGLSARLQFGPKNVIGYFGQLHPLVADSMSLEAPIVMVELMLENLPIGKAKPTKARSRLEFSELMPLERDFAFIVPREIEAGEIVKAAQNANRTLIDDVRVFDVYSGKGIADGYRSIAISVHMQPRDKTLNEAQIEAICANIVAEVMKRTGAILRQ